MLDDNDKMALRGIYTEAVQAWQDKLALEREAEAAAGRFSAKLQDCMEYLRHAFKQCYPDSSVTVDLIVGKGMIHGFTVTIRTGDMEDNIEVQLSPPQEDKSKKIIVV